VKGGASASRPLWKSALQQREICGREICRRTPL
jgi:hypothetical protein